ncbi:hypothetical protein D3C84_1106000 [compost metagenome]
MPQRALAPGFEAGKQASRSVQGRGLEVRAAENRALQAGAMVHQVSLGDVAAHAVAKQEYRCARKLLADVLAERAQIVDYAVPAIVSGEQA